MSLDRLGDLLAPYLEKLGVHAPDTTNRILTRWEELAGDPWAAETRPAALSHGELVLDVVDAATLSVLRYRTGELLDHLANQVGEGTVTAIRLRVTRQPF